MSVFANVVECSESNVEGHVGPLDPPDSPKTRTPTDEAVKKVLDDMELLGIGTPPSPNSAQERRRQMRERFQKMTDDFKAARFRKSLHKEFDQVDPEDATGTPKESRYTVCSSCLRKEREKTERAKRLVKKVITIAEYYTVDVSESDDN